MPTLVLDLLHNTGSKPVLYCFTISHKSGEFSTLHIYDNDKSRDNALRLYKKRYILFDSVFYVFEIPLGLFLKHATKEV